MNKHQGKMSAGPRGKATQAKRRTRLAPKAREQMILEAAVEFFAEHGFTAQIRELAARIGVSQSLIYRYFGTKEVLVDRVYQRTFLWRWDPRWEDTLTNRSLPIEDRLKAFFRSYLDAIDDRNWVRISMYSSLAGWGLTQRYIQQYVDKLLVTIADEIGLDPGEAGSIEREVIWHIQSTFIYYLVRKHIHGSDALEEKSVLIEEIINIYFKGIRSRPIKGK